MAVLFRYARSAEFNKFDRAQRAAPATRHPLIINIMGTWHKSARAQHGTGQLVLAVNNPATTLLYIFVIK
jgi:hypothetical protein